MIFEARDHVDKDVLVFYCVEPEQDEIRLDDLEPSQLYDIVRKEFRENSIQFSLQIHDLTESSNTQEVQIEVLNQLRRMLIDIPASQRPQDHDKLYFYVLTVTGHLFSDWRRLSQIFSEAIESRPLDLDSLVFEDRVHGMVIYGNGHLKGRNEFAADSGGRLKAGLSKEFEQRIYEWLESRLAVEKIRSMYKPLPGLLKKDATRVISVIFLLYFFFLLPGIVGHFFPDQTYLAEYVMLAFTVAIPGYTFILFGKNIRVYFRPLIRLRIVALLTILAVLAFNETPWLLGFASTQKRAFLIALVCSYVTLSYWRTAVYRIFGGVLTQRNIDIAKTRFKMLFFLHLEDSLALVILFDIVLGAEVFQTLTSESRDILLGEFGFFGLMPRQFIVDIIFVQLAIHPPLILSWTPICMTLSVFMYFLARRMG